MITAEMIEKIFADKLVTAKLTPETISKAKEIKEAVAQSSLALKATTQ